MDGINKVQATYDCQICHNNMNYFQATIKRTGWRGGDWLKHAHIGCFFERLNLIMYRSMRKEKVQGFSGRGGRGGMTRPESVWKKKKHVLLHQHLILSWTRWRPIG